MPASGGFGLGLRFGFGATLDVVEVVVVVEVTGADAWTVSVVDDCELPQPASTRPVAASSPTSCAILTVEPSYACQTDRAMTRNRLLELIADTSELLDLDEFRHGMLAALHRAIPADWVGLSDVGPDARSVVEIVDPPLAPEIHAGFAELAHQNPLVRRLDETRDGRAYRISDVVTQKQFHKLEIYERVYAPIGLEHQMAFTLESGADRMLGVHLSRRKRDFSDRERDLLNSARPFLIQAYRNAIRYTAALTAGADPVPPPLESLAALGLTHRQAEVLQQLATGASEHDISAHLGLSRRTVQKHAEHIYRRLAVNSRSEAAAIAWRV